VVEGYGKHDKKVKQSMSPLFKRKRKPTLSELQGVPEGMFRCDLCDEVQPIESSLAGTIVNVNEATKEVYTVCGLCAFSAGRRFREFPTPYFGAPKRRKSRSISPVSVGPQGIAFVNWDANVVTAFREYLKTTKPTPNELRKYLEPRKEHEPS